MRRFYVELAQQLQTLLPLSDMLLKHLQFLDPELRHSLDEDSVCFIGKSLCFGEADLSALQIEWRRYKICTQVNLHCITCLYDFQF